MSAYYNPAPRSANWNYGGNKWKLSRSKIDLFIECPRCFYLDNKLGVKRPPGFPFNLNSAVDKLLKLEFDTHRVKGETHPLIKKYGIAARPVAHEELNKWRDVFEGIQYVHPATGMTISGAIDDLWINDNQEYIVVDYKATSKAEKIETLEKDWQGGYKRQMEVYQWLLRRKGYQVSDTGYFVYCNGLTDREAFDARLEFEITLIPYKGNDTWVETTILNIKKCLDDPRIPKAAATCDYCNYRRTVYETEHTHAG